MSKPAYIADREHRIRQNAEDIRQLTELMRHAEDVGLPRAAAWIKLLISERERAS